MGRARQRRVPSRRKGPEEEVEDAIMGLLDQGFISDHAVGFVINLEGAAALEVER